MFHVHNCIFEGIKYHNLQHDIIFTDRESPFLPSLCNTEVNEIPSFKGGAVIAMIETVYQGGESIRSKYTNIPPYLRNSALTISTNALRLQTCQDEKKNRKERKSIDKHSYARLRKDLQEEQWPPNEPSLDSKQSETKKRTNKQNNCPGSWKSLLRASTVQTFFWGSVNDPFTKKKSPNSVEKNTVYYTC